MRQPCHDCQARNTVPRVELLPRDIPVEAICGTWPPPAPMSMAQRAPFASTKKNCTVYTHSPACVRYGCAPCRNTGRPRHSDHYYQFLAGDSGCSSQNIHLISTRKASSNRRNVRNQPTLPRLPIPNHIHISLPVNHYGSWAHTVPTGRHPTRKQACKVL